MRDVVAFRVLLKGGCKLAVGVAVMMVRINDDDDDMMMRHDAPSPSYLFNLIFPGIEFVVALEGDGVGFLARDHLQAVLFERGPIYLGDLLQEHQRHRLVRVLWTVMVTATVTTWVRDRVCEYEKGL